MGEGLGDGRGCARQGREGAGWWERVGEDGEIGDGGW